MDWALSSLRLCCKTRLLKARAVEESAVATSSAVLRFHWVMALFKRVGEGSFIRSMRKSWWEQLVIYRQCGSFWAQMHPDNARMKTVVRHRAGLTRAGLIYNKPHHINKKSGSERANVHIIPTFSICWGILQVSIKVKAKHLIHSHPWATNTTSVGFWSNWSISALTLYFWECSEGFETWILR